MIKAIITDFDGTLVDTFEANLRAYQEALSYYCFSLTEEKYRDCFGLRFDAFMSRLGIFDSELSLRIRDKKANCYPKYFQYLRINSNLINIIKTFRFYGIKVAIASTARKTNLTNVLNYLKISDLFDVIIAGQDVGKGKPNPEIYNYTMNKIFVSPEDCLIFEDSDIGVEAAKSSGANYIRVTSEWFN